jgi:outer membrane protein TolC
LEPNPNPLQFPTNPEDVRIEQTESITLQQAIDLARRNSQVLQIAGQQVEQSRAVLREQQAALYPDLNFQMGASRQMSAGGELGVRAQQRFNNSRANGTGQPARQAEPNFGSNSLNSALELNYNIDLFGGRRAAIRAAEEQLRFRELDVERQAEELRFDTAEAYYNLQNADGQVAIRQASVRNALQSLRDAEALERAGVGTRFAVLQAQANLANEQQQLSVARRDQRVAQRRLAEILNISQTANLTAADPVEQAGSWRLSLEESIVQAFRNRPELEQQLVQRDISKQERRSIQAGRLPQLSVGGSYNVQGQDPDNPAPFISRGWADGYSLQARLTWSIFDGGAANARVRQRNAEITIAESRFDQLRNQVRREVEQAYFGLESSFENIETSEAGVLQSREALRLARLRFQAGVGTQTDVIQAETELTRAERNRLSAIITYNLGLSSLQRAVSNLPTNNLSDAP